MSPYVVHSPRATSPAIAAYRSACAGVARPRTAPGVATSALEAAEIAEIAAEVRPEVAPEIGAARTLAGCTRVRFAGVIPAAAEGAATRISKALAALVALEGGGVL